MRLTNDDKGSSILVTLGETFTIVLIEIPTTGFRWEVDGELTGLKLEKVELQQPSAASGQANPVGGSSKRVFTFKAVEASERTLSLKLCRSFGMKSVADTFTVTVTVAALEGNE